MPAVPCAEEPSVGSVPSTFPVWSCATTEQVIRSFPNPLQAAVIDVPHKRILPHLPKTYKSYKRESHPSIAPKVTFAPFPIKLQHKLGQRWAAKGSSFVPVTLEEKHNCWLSISQQEQWLQCHAKRISTSLYFFVDSYDLLFSKSVFLYYSIYQKNTIHCLEYAPYFTLERENDRNTRAQSLEDEKENTIKTVVFELTRLWHVTAVSTESSRRYTLWTTSTSKIKIKR